MLLYILNPTDNTIENKSSVLNEGIYKGKTANSLNTIRIIVYNLIHKVYILNSPLYNLIKPMKQ